MSVVAETILLGMADFFVPSGVARKSNSTFYRRIVCPHLLSPLVSRVASSAIRRDIGISLLILTLVMLFGATQEMDIKDTWSSLAATAALPTLFWGSLFTAFIHTYSLASLWVFPAASCLSAPGNFFDGTNRRENPVQAWLYNLFSGVPLEGNWKQRLQDVMTYVDSSRATNAPHNTSVNQIELNKAVESRSFDVVALREAVGTASWFEAALQLLGLLITWGLVNVTVFAMKSIGSI